MIKTIYVNEVPLTLKMDASVILKYKMLHNTELFSDIAKIEKIRKGGDISIENINIVFDVLQKIIYTLAYNYNKQIGGMVEFLETIDELPIETMMEEVFPLLFSSLNSKKKKN